MDYLCLNCGHINYKRETNVCESCNYENDLKEYNKFSEYAKRAVQYGYQYRVVYEQQLAIQGEIPVRYSIVNPETYFELLAVAALGGIVGNSAYDLVKHVAKQIHNRLTKKQKDAELTPEEQDLIILMEDNVFLNKFIVYIQSYYKGMPNIDKRIAKAISDEVLNPIIANLITNETKMNKLKDAVEKGEDFNEAYSQLLMLEIRKELKKRPDKPNLNELNNTLKALKREIKRLKKQRLKESK